MKIMISTDMEGCAGVLDFENWVSPGGRYYEKGKRLLTEEVNAAIAGFIEGGVSEIIVIDAHGDGGIDPELLHEEAILVDGHGEKVWPWGLDKTYSALAFVGQHAKAGTPYSHMTHTGNLRIIDDRINDCSIGEYGRWSLCAMELGIPTILACGEKALAKEAEALTPGVITVSVKEGLLPDDGYRNVTSEEYGCAKLSAAHLSPLKARRLIKEGALKAVNLLKTAPKTFKYPDYISAPYKRIIEYREIKTENDPPFVSITEHNESIIDLLNLPLNRKYNIPDKGAKK